ncbi:LysR family transcriptional regulator [Paraburkholderia sp. RL18-103-BIB-C]|jgi:DNA-binding transcriptional LysR family regulator|uniref:LysR family transcriptional regulator n=1 Tax=unclassified Paraburkholderia TaxID=2615204 RepID=UPI0038BDB4D1
MISNVSDLDLRLIRTFLAVVDARGVTAAQVTLNVSQPAISSQLTTLETRLGFRLCERGRSGFSLTGRGERFAESARKLLDAIDNFSTESRNLDKKLVGNLTICIIGHAELKQNALLSQAIQRFLGRDQAVHLSVIVKSPGEIEQEVFSGAIDVAIGYFWHRAPLLEYVPLFMEKQTAYCGTGHPLFGRCNATEAELTDLVWVHRRYPVPEANYFSCNPGVTAGPLAENMEAAALLIMSGKYIGYLPNHYAEPYVKQGLLRAPSKQLLSHDVMFHMATRKAPRRTDVTQAFVDDLRAVYLAESGVDASVL